MYQLDQQLMADTVLVGQFTLSDVLLMNDKQYPWVILVPRKAKLREMFQLSLQDQQQLTCESSFVSAKMHMHYQADKMNVATLGNVVEQLHIHHVARYKKDGAWPKPVWGALPALAYDPEELQVECDSLKALFAEYFIESE